MRELARFKDPHVNIWDFPDGKESTVVQEAWVQFLGQEDPLEKGMATQSNILAWSTVWAEEPGGLVHGVTRSWTQLATNTYFSIKIIMLLLVFFHCCECGLGLLRSV